MSMSLPSGVSADALLGYLNFSEGRPDPRFQQQLAALFAHLAASGSSAPWEDLPRVLLEHLDRLHQTGQAAFQDVSQAEAVVQLVFAELLPAYRAFHRDLLFHRSEAELWQPFFVARACEAVLAQRGPWKERDRVVQGALRQLNDFVGHRPVAQLEGRRGEVDEHEKCRPIPLYLRDAGVAPGRYAPLIAQALALLGEGDPRWLQEASLNLALLDELAVDPRSYDFGHPVDKRTNYVFGEWDPHVLDGQARYRRFVVREVVLDALWQRVEQGPEAARVELAFEAGAVLAGTMLMASAVSGWGPAAHDSSVSLGTLLPRIAALREGFYAGLVARSGGARGQRLVDEARRFRQPLASARQHLNQQLAAVRSLQLQKSRLALLYAQLGQPAACARQLAGVATASTRVRAGVHSLLTTCELRLARGELDAAIALLAQAEDLLRRGIACGALMDPWNILGFQAQFPRSAALEDSVRDHRVDELTEGMDRLFAAYARLLGEAAMRGTADNLARPTQALRQLAQWWDRFASTSVAGVEPVVGREAASSATRVAQILTRWREHAGGADLAFWRQQLEHFDSPRSFALVIDALLAKRDLRAGLALLVTWIGQPLPLSETNPTFHELAARWVRLACEEPDAGLVIKGFAYLDANAEELALAPKLDPLAEATSKAGPGEREDVYSAAYEGVTYRDSTDDDVEGEVLDVMPRAHFALADQVERLRRHLEFLATLAQLWHEAAARTEDLPDEARADWQAHAAQNLRGLLDLLDAVEGQAVPRPSGTFESLVEFDRRRETKRQLAVAIVRTCLDHVRAANVLSALGTEANGHFGRPWEGIYLNLLRALRLGDRAAVTALLPAFTQALQSESLLYVGFEHGGQGQPMLAVLALQKALRVLCTNLPRLGLLRETFELLRLARAREQAPAEAKVPRVSEFDHLARAALEAITAELAAAAQREHLEAPSWVPQLEPLFNPFLELWGDHQGTLRHSALEAVLAEPDWGDLAQFIQTYGRDLFTAKFLTLGNLRGILQSGVGPYLKALQEDGDPLAASKLLDDLDGPLTRTRAERHLALIVQALVENFEHYRDYRQMATQADDGANLYQLLDFLRAKAQYQRAAWLMMPLNFMHGVLARHDGAAAAFFREQIRPWTAAPAEQHLGHLAAIEQKYNLKLMTIRDRFEERFVKPMELDRLAALIRAAEPQLDREEPSDLERELTPYADTPSGAGLEVPHWLQRLEQEWSRRKQPVAESDVFAPRAVLPFAELVRGW